MSTYLLIYLLITHVFIDATAGTINPILERLGSKYHVAHVAMGLVAALLQASLSFSQPLFGYIYDRFRAYWLIPLAALLAGGCLGAVGLVDSFGLLMVLIVMAGLAIGAFHPGATALAGRSSDKRRPLTIAIFVCAGALGLAAAPLFISRMVVAKGLGATAWIFAPTAVVFVVALLAWRACRKLPTTKSDSHPKGKNTRRSIFSRPMILLFILAASRSFAAIAAVSGIAFLMTEKTADKSSALLSTGNAIALFSLAIGFGGLLSGLFVRPETEKRGIIISLIVAAPFLIIFPLLSIGWMLLVIALGGIALSSTIPLVTAIGQRLVPQSSAVASSILMGFSWGVGGVIAPLAVTSLGPIISYALAMPILIAAGLIAALLATLAMPKVMHPQQSSHLASARTIA